MWRVWVRRGYRVLVGKPEGRNHWGDLGVDGWIILGWICMWRVWVRRGYRVLVGKTEGRSGCIILGWISRRWDVGIWTGLGWPRIGAGGGRL